MTNDHTKKKEGVNTYNRKTTNPIAVMHGRGMTNRVIDHHFQSDWMSTNNNHYYWIGDQFHLKTFRLLMSNQEENYP